MADIQPKKHFKNSSAPKELLRRGAVTLLRMPTPDQPDKPGERLKRALVWNVHKNEDGKVKDLDVLWISSSATTEDLEKKARSHHLITRGPYLHKNMGYDNPVMVGVDRLYKIPVNADFFPTGRTKGNERQVLNTESGIAVRVFGQSGDGFADALIEAKRRSTLSQGSVVMVNLPKGNTPGVPGNRTVPALVWQPLADQQGQIRALDLMWMKPFRESKEIMDLYSDHHVMVAKKQDKTAMGFDKEMLLIDPSHLIRVPITKDFFPQSVTKQHQHADCNVFHSAGDNTAVVIKGTAPHNLMDGPIKSSLLICREDQKNKVEQTQAARDQRELQKISSAFGLNKLKL